MSSPPCSRSSSRCRHRAATGTSHGLVSHLVGAPGRFAEGLRGGQPKWGARPEPATGDWVGDFRMAAERGLAFMMTGLTADNRGAAFAPEVPVPSGAPVYDRLAAIAGREP